MSDVPDVVQRFLEGIETGNWSGMEGYLAPDVLYDETVPGWRSQYDGREQVLSIYRNEWTGRNTWRILEHEVLPVPDGIVLTFEARGSRFLPSHGGSIEFGVRLVSIFRLADGLITEHRVYCCGEWDEQTLRRVEAEAPKVSRSVAVA